MLQLDWFVLSSSCQCPAAMVGESKRQLKTNQKQTGQQKTNQKQNQWQKLKRPKHQKQKQKLQMLNRLPKTKGNKNQQKA